MFQSAPKQYTSRDRFQRVRQATIKLIENLEPEDLNLQSMEDASPAKWHLAHTSWFFEEFIIRPHEPNYQGFSDRFAQLFNSYYAGAGDRFTRARRGMLSRPSLAETLAYRDVVDTMVSNMFGRGTAPGDIVELGCHHEMQHQELLLTDLLHGFSQNPLEVTYHAPSPSLARAAAAPKMVPFTGGLVDIGHTGSDFSYDCEQPRHQVLLKPFLLCSQNVTCGEWLEFMEDGGYEKEVLWLADGWANAQQKKWRAPLYWRKEMDGSWSAYSLRGRQPIDPAAPVAHISFYEAGAFARWAGARLPTESEWEFASATVPVAGEFLETGRLRPSPNYLTPTTRSNKRDKNTENSSPTDPKVGARSELCQMWGGVWEWTHSAFGPYPGFVPNPGVLGEYNGKFMVNQLVLRGGSCLTPGDSMRRSYRNFFYPHQRWQMSGLRLAKNTA